VVASHLVLALQSIVSRNVDPTEQAVVSVTAFKTSSDAFNVIPSRVEMMGTVRTLSAKVRDQVEARMQALCETIPAGFGATGRLDYERNYPVMVNHEEQTEFAASVARTITGQCEDAPLVMGGEDFAFMLEERPGAYILMGNGDTAMVHSPDYDFNDAVIPTGCSWWAGIVEQRMPLG